MLERDAQQLRERKPVGKAESFLAVVRLLLEQTAAEVASVSRTGCPKKQGRGILNQSEELLRDMLSL